MKNISNDGHNLLVYDLNKENALQLASDKVKVAVGACNFLI